MEPNVKQKRDVWTALALLGLAAFYLFNTFQFSPGGSSNLPNARTLPFLLTGALVLLSFALLWQSRFQHIKRPSALVEVDDEDAMLIEDPSRLRLGLFLAILVGYALIMPYVGFLIATALLGVLMLTIVFRAFSVINLLAVVALTGFSYWLFARVLNILLP